MEEDEHMWNMWLEGFWWGIVFGWLILFMVVAGIVPSALGASVTTQINMTIENESITIQTPGQMFQTTCGQQFTKAFDITNTYDQTLIYNTTTIINQTLVYNYTTAQNNPNNCTIVYNITDSNLTQAIIDRLNQTSIVCQGNFTNSATYMVNFTGCDFLGNISRGNQELRDYITNTLIPDAWECDQCQSKLLGYQAQLNVTQEKLKMNESMNLIWVIVVVILFILLVIILATIFGTQLWHRKINTAPGIASKPSYQQPQNPQQPQQQEVR